jgi:hypothetical protein
VLTRASRYVLRFALIASVSMERRFAAASSRFGVCMFQVEACTSPTGAQSTARRTHELRFAELLDVRAALVHDVRGLLVALPVPEPHELHPALVLRPIEALLSHQPQFLAGGHRRALAVDLGEEALAKEERRGKPATVIETC